MVKFTVNANIPRLDRQPEINHKQCEKFLPLIYSSIGCQEINPEKIYRFYIFIFKNLYLNDKALLDLPKKNARKLLFDYCHWLVIYFRSIY